MKLHKVFGCREFKKKIGLLPDKFNDMMMHIDAGEWNVDFIKCIDTNDEVIIFVFCNTDAPKEDMIQKVYKIGFSKLESCMKNFNMFTEYMKSVNGEIINFEKETLDTSKKGQSLEYRYIIHANIPIFVANAENGEIQFERLRTIKNDIIEKYEEYRKNN